jgi:putative flippase GtrA
VSAQQRVLPLVRDALRFLLSTCLGLTVDLAVFGVGVWLGATPGVANVVSSGCAVVVMYAVVTRYVFRGGRSRGSFVAFVAWYVVSIAVFSVLVEVLHDSTGWAPFVCKLVSLPLSFAANFGFSKIVFRGAGRNARDLVDRPAEGSGVVVAREGTR